MATGPLLVYGPRSIAYDFGAMHPLTPRRFGPGIDLLREVGAEPGLAPEPATDAELGLVHSAAYVAAVRRLSAAPEGWLEGGLGPGDNPPFAGMHEAAAAVAGGSLQAVEAILRGEVEHAFHPGGGLHHAMPGRASGFCIYNDPALAIARARLAGRRVLYVDLDVHHGDGVQAIHEHDPGVLTFSIHETGQALFPGTGFLRDFGRDEAAGTSLNLPLEPYATAATWLAAVRAVVPAIAAAFGPDLIVSQHGSDSHAWDPLAHLRVTTDAMGEAARLVDRLAHRHANGAWLATGGGGYDAYRVVPRAWVLTWLAGAHRDVPPTTPAAWRDRWSTEAARFHQVPLPGSYGDDPATVGLVVPDSLGEMAEARAQETVALLRSVAVPLLLREADARGWWQPDLEPHGAHVDRVLAGGEIRERGTPTLLEPLTVDRLEGLALAPRVIPPFDPAQGLLILRAALQGGARAVGAAVGGTLVGLVVVAPPDSGFLDREGLRAAAGQSAHPGAPELLAACGVAPEQRGRGLATALLRAAAVSSQSSRRRSVLALVTAAERDAVTPLPRETRRRVARALLAGAGFREMALPRPLAAVDPGAIVASLELG